MVTKVKTRLRIIFRSENTRNYLLLVGFFTLGVAEVRDAFHTQNLMNYRYDDKKF